MAIKKEMWGIVIIEDGKITMTSHCYFTRLECKQARDELCSEGVWEDAKIIKFKTMAKFDMGKLKDYK